MAKINSTNTTELKRVEHQLTVACTAKDRQWACCCLEIDTVNQTSQRRDMWPSCRRTGGSSAAEPSYYKTTQQHTMQSTVKSTVRPSPPPVHHPQHLTIIVLQNKLNFTSAKQQFLVHGQVTIIFVVSVCLWRVFLSRL